MKVVVKKSKKLVLKVESVKSKKKNWINKVYPNGPKWTGD